MFPDTRPHGILRDRHGSSWRRGVGALWAVRSLGCAASPDATSDVETGGDAGADVAAAGDATAADGAPLDARWLDGSSAFDAARRHGADAARGRTCHPLMAVLCPCVRP